MKRIGGSALVLCTSLCATVPVAAQPPGRGRPCGSVVPAEGADGASAPPPTTFRGAEVLQATGGLGRGPGRSGCGGECSLTLPLAAHLAELHDQSRTPGGSSWRGLRGARRRTRFQRIGLTRPVEFLFSRTSGSPRYETDPLLFNVASSDSSAHNRASPLLFSATIASVLRSDSPW